MPTGAGTFFAWPGGGPGAVMLLVLLAVLVLAGFWIRRLRRTIAAKNERLIGEAERRGAAEDRTRWVSDHDVYTELPRLHHFIDQVNEALRAGAGVREKQIVALKLAELDETIRALGHDLGIGMARRFAERLKSLGLDAYGVTGRDVFLAFGDRERIDAELRGKLGSADDTFAAGIAPWPQIYAGSVDCGRDGSDARELVRRAETALGHAVAAREPWVEWQESLELGTDVQLVRLFRESRAEGLTAYFQPQVDVRSGAIVGDDARARWSAPGTGAVATAKLARLLEEAGAIRTLTRRMISEAARVAAALRKHGGSCPISVNVAPSDLLGDDISRNICSALREHGARTTDLKLELTETSLARSPESMRWVMGRLRESGLGLSIDDFGTGFSSLAYLNDLPVDEVKIDRSFISGLPGKQRNRSIVRATIAMAHELGLAVVAEGVDEDAAMQILREDRCDRAQGFLIAEPLPEAKFLEFFADNRRRASRARTGA